MNKYEFSEMVTTQGMTLDGTQPKLVRWFSDYLEDTMDVTLNEYLADCDDTSCLAAIAEEWYVESNLLN